MRLLLAIATVALLMLAGAAQPAQAYRLGGERWPGQTITYHSTPSYKTVVRAAAQIWNASGARVRFRPVSRHNARVLITGGYGTGCRGVAQLGYERGQRARVRLSSGCRYESAMTQVAAHELGHILGLTHENRGCSLMNAGGDGVDNCEREPPFHYRCRVLEIDDVRGAVRRYGGTVQPVRPDPFCPVFAAPAAPADLTLGLGPDGELVAGLTIARPQAFIADGDQTIFIKLVVYRYADACPAVPGAGPPTQEAGATYGGQITRIDYLRQPGPWCYAIAVQDVGDRRGPFTTATVVVPPRGV